MDKEGFQMFDTVYEKIRDRDKENILIVGVALLFLLITPLNAYAATQPIHHRH